MTRTVAMRALDDRDIAAALACCARDPVGNVFLASRIEAAGLDPWRLGAQVWGLAGDGELAALCYAGGNVVPASADAAAARLFAERIRRQGRRCSSIVGRAEPVAALWSALAPDWGPARDVRERQPLLVIDGPPLVPPDPLVRRVRPEELDVLMPAAVAMFTEEVGVSPLAGDGGAAYRAKVAELIRDGRAFARVEDGRVVFKAEIGAVSRQACQVQGVWVDPQLRGRGLAGPGMAAVVAAALPAIAPVVSLYVNDYNTAARRAYARAGFRDAGAFMSVLF